MGYLGASLSSRRVKNTRRSRRLGFYPAKVQSVAAGLRACQRPGLVAMACEICIERRCQDGLFLSPGFLGHALESFD